MKECLRQRNEADGTPIGGGNARKHLSETSENMCSCMSSSFHLHCSSYPARRSTLHSNTQSIRFGQPTQAFTSRRRHSSPPLHKRYQMGAKSRAPRIHRQIEISLPSGREGLGYSIP
jgi:hypothetical protein